MSDKPLVSKLIGNVTIQAELSAWKAEDPKTGKWDFTDKPAIILRRVRGGNVSELKVDLEGEAQAVSDCIQEVLLIGR